MFQGLSGATMDLMRGVRFNSEKGWFEAHKEEYLATFQRPTKVLIDEMHAAPTDRHPNLDLICKMSRIYRDTRRLFNRSPYKDHPWLSLTRPHKEGCIELVFWLELDPEGYSYSTGSWQILAITMAKFRACMDREPKVIGKLAHHFQKQDVFVLEGENYKRPKAAPSRLLTPWCSKKSFVLSYDALHGEPLWSHDLVDLPLEGYEFLLPYYERMLSPSGDPDPQTR